PGQQVEDLGGRGAHPGALARREDDHREVLVGHVLCLLKDATGAGIAGSRSAHGARPAHTAVSAVRAPPPGFEPGPHSSKGCRAAVTPRRIAPSRESSLPDAARLPA